MKKFKIIFVIILLTSFFLSCTKDEEVSIDKFNGYCTIRPIVYSDDNYTINGYSGFSFTEGGIISYPNSEDLMPDFVYENNNNYPRFKLPVNSFTKYYNFCFLNVFDNEDLAIKYFESPGITTDDADFYKTISYSTPLSANQIWLIQTKDFNFGLIRIISINYYDDTDSDESEVYFEWKYLNDGTLNF